MGNRAVITTSKNLDSVGVYLHWNGGRDSVEGFLAYCKAHGFRSPETDCYGWARLAQVCANFFGGDGLSIGVDLAKRLDCDNGDNGVYIIRDWEIVDRLYAPSLEQRECALKEFMLAVDQRMPEEHKLGDKAIEEYCNR